MAERLPVVYLAGAIRDGVEDDLLWRELAIDLLGDRAVVLNPTGGKAYLPDMGAWTVSGIHSGGRFIVKHDFWCVRQADIVVVNLEALAQGYSNIGTLMELGAAAILGKLVYTIVGEGFSGHLNKGFGLHPFIEQSSAAVFPDVGSCITFLQHHLDVLSGRDPHYKGVLTCLASRQAGSAPAAESTSPTSTSAMGAGLTSAPPAPSETLPYRPDPPADPTSPRTMRLSASARRVRR